MRALTVLTLTAAAALPACGADASPAAPARTTAPARSTSAPSEGSASEPAPAQPTGGASASQGSFVQLPPPALTARQARLEAAGRRQGVRRAPRTVMVAGRRVSLLLPREPTTRLVYFLHGAEGNNAFAPVRRDLFAALSAAGYAIASSAGGGRAWGNDASVRSYGDAIGGLRDMGLTDVYLLGQSMGGVAALRLVDAVHPVAWAGIFPVCNLGGINASLMASVDRAWAGTPPTGPLLPADVEGLPMLFFSSPGDTLVPKATNTDVCAPALSQAGAQVTVQETVGGHGNPSNFRPEQTVAFFDAAGG